MTGPPGPLCAYGHSWVFGTGASRPDLGFAALAAHTLRRPLDLRAESGSLSAATARLVTVRPPPPAAVLVLMTGLNDARRHGGSAAARRSYADALARVLAAFHRAAPAARVVAVEQPYVLDYAGYAPFDRASDTVVDAFNATLVQVASRHPMARVVPVPGWTADAMVAADGVHPNDVGHCQVASAVAAAARDLRATG